MGISFLNAEVRNRCSELEMALLCRLANITDTLDQAIDALLEAIEPPLEVPAQ